MEAINMAFDAKVFDELVHNSLLQAGTVTVAVKNGATQGGRPGAVIAFEVQLPSGEVGRAQATVTLRQLRAALIAINARYADLS